MKLEKAMKIIVIAACTTLLLSACGGGGSSSTGGEGSNGNEIARILPTTNLSGAYQYYGYVTLIDDTLLDQVDRDANFLKMRSTEPASVFVNSVPMSADSCSLRITKSLPTDPGIIGFPEAQFDLVSAGESYTLTSDAGTYATITLADDRFDVATYPSPNPLTLDFPGDVFPAFSALTMPQVQAVQNFSPSRNETLTKDTIITWDPTGLADHHIYLTLTDYDETEKWVILNCRMLDDGNFALPANVVSMLQTHLGSDFELDGAKQQKRNDTLFIKGDALLLVTREIKDLGI